MSAGVEGKWEALNEERLRLREKVKELETHRDKLQATVAELEQSAPEGMADVIGERDVLRARVIELQREQSAVLVAPNEEEQAVFDALMAVMEQFRQWGLIANRHEVTAAVHVLQGFVIQHMLQRISAGHHQWGKWFDPEAAEETG